MWTSEQHNFPGEGILADADAPSYFDDDLNLETIEELLEALAGYDEQGRVEIDHWPNRSEDAPVSPPRVLTNELQTLHGQNPDARMEVVMQPHQFDAKTGAIVSVELEPGCVASPGFKLFLIPAIKCLDCPGKLYLARPGSVVEDLGIHMRNKSHRQSLRMRQMIDSNTADRTITAIFQAIKDQNLIELTKILGEILPVNGGSLAQEDVRRSKIWSTILTYTISFGTIDMLACILDHDFGALYDVGSQGHTSLHLACHLGKSDMARLLIRSGASLKATDHGDRTPLDRAMEQGYIETAVTAVREWAKEKHRKPVSVACSFGYTEIVEALLKQGEAVDNDDTEPGYLFTVPYPGLSDIDSTEQEASRMIYKSMKRKGRLYHRKTHRLAVKNDDVLDEALTYASAAAVRLLLEAGAKICPEHARCIGALRSKATTEASDEGIERAVGDTSPRRSSEECQEQVTRRRKKAKYSEPTEKLDVLAEFGYRFDASSPESLRDSPPYSPPCTYTPVSSFTPPSNPFEAYSFALPPFRSLINDATPLEYHRTTVRAYGTGSFANDAHCYDRDIEIEEPVWTR